MGFGLLRVVVDQSGDSEEAMCLPSSQHAKPMAVAGSGFSRADRAHEDRILASSMNAPRANSRILGLDSLGSREKSYSSKVCKIGKWASRTRGFRAGLDFSLGVASAQAAPGGIPHRAGRCRLLRWPVCGSSPRRLVGASGAASLASEYPGWRR